MSGTLEEQRKAQIEARLTPGGAQQLCHSLPGRTAPNDRLQRLYRLLSLMSSAMRERADDQSRSALRVDVPSASAVSAVVNPAK